jgi:hypothetical protein
MLDPAGVTLADVRRAARTRRARLLLSAAVTVTSCLAIAAMLTLLGERYRARWDMSAAGSQQLAPRTLKLLEKAAPGHRIIIATDLRTVDPRARQNLMDVLADLRAARSDLSSTIIDTGSPAGNAQFKDLVADLYQRDKAAIDAQVESLLASSESAAQLARTLRTTLSPQLLKIRDGIAPSAAQAGSLASDWQFWEQAAAGLRVRADDLDRAAKDATMHAGATLAAGSSVPLPSSEKASAAVLPSLDGALKDAQALSERLDRLARNTNIPALALEAARIAGPQVGQLRDQATVARTRLLALPRLDITRVADVLRAGNAALIVAPASDANSPQAKTLVAMDLDSLLPSALWIQTAQAGRGDLRRKVEETLGTAIASLVSPARPIVILTHAEPKPFLLESGFVDALRDRLFQRGMDCTEWSVISQPAPDLTALGSGAGSRPQIFVTLATNDGAAAPAQGAPTGAERAATLAQRVGTLLDEGRPVIVSLAPSMLPTYGENDPMALQLERLGVTARTGSTLLSEQTGARVRTVETDRVLQPTGDSATNPLPGAVRGLPTYLTWAIPLEQTSGAKTTFTPLIAATIPGAWAESEWMRLRQVRREERSLLPDQPVFNQGRDLQRDSWTLAAAIEQPREGASPPRRAIIVGSNDWFIDQVTQQAINVDGRPSYQFPGNLELLESGVMWLAGQDDLIAQSAIAQAVSIVKPMPESQLRGVRLAIVAGLPLLVLVAGGLVRALRK